MMGALDDFLDETPENTARPEAQASPTATIDPAAVNAISSFLDEDRDQLSYSVQQGAVGDSGKSIRILQAIGRTRLPREFVERNLDYVEKESAKQEFDPDKFLRESPVVAEYLKDPIHAAAVRDDYSKLSFLEKQLKYIPARTEEGALTHEYGQLGMDALRGQITPDQRTRQAALEKRLQEIDELGKSLDLGFVERLPGAGLGMMNQMLSSAPEVIKGAAGTVVAGAAAGAAAAATTGNPALIPAGAGMGAAWSLTGGFVYASAQAEAGSAFLEYEKLKDEKGQPLDRTTITGLALLVGALNGPLDGLTGVEGLTSGTLKRTMRQKVRDLLASPSARGALLNLAQTVGLTAAQEGATEFLQSLVTTSGGEIAKSIQDGKGPLETARNIVTPENIAKALAEGQKGLEGSIGPSIVLGTPKVLAERQEAKIAKQNEQAFLQMGQATQDAKAISQLPEHLQKIIQAATEGGPVETLYVPTEAFGQYFQSKGVDPRQVAEAITGSVESYDQAVATGQDLEIKTSDYASKIAGTEHNQFFARELRTAVDQMNAREAEEWVQMMDQQAQAQEGVTATAVADPLAKITQDITGQLSAIGFDPNVIDQYASLFAQRYQARAERRGLGEDPAELFKQTNLTITRHLPEVLRKLNQKTSELDALLNRLRSGDLPKQQDIFGPSLSDFLLDKGGLQDQGGELKARDVDGPRQAFQKKLVQPKGLTLDQAAELAAEAGYLEERNVNALLDALDKDARGNPVFAMGRENQTLFDVQQNLDALKAFLADRSIDLAKTSNDQIKALFNEGVQQPLTAEGQTFNKDEKASITFLDQRTIIQLFNGANLSSLVHESGHLYLNELIDDATTAGTNEQLRTDLDTLLKWMGLDVTSASGRDAVKAAVQTKQHEQFARGFEAYALEGKAPSQALREAFAKFRQWLVHLYRLFRKAMDAGQVLDVKLTNEVREVMDRMLATDEQIDQAAQEAEVLPLFTDAAQAGMSEAQWKNYQETVGKASLKARETLQAKLMSQFTRQQQTWWKEARAKMLQVVTNEVNQQPEYIALAVLQTGKMPDGSALPDGVTVAKLDKKGIAETFGKDFLKRMPHKTTVAKDGAHHETVAQQLGYTNGQDFVMALVNARPKNQLIEAETDRRMTEEYGDMRFDGTLAEAARVAVLNEHQEQVIQAELKALNTKRSEVMPFVKAAMKEEGQKRRGALSVLTPPLDAVRETARRQVAKTPIRKLQPYTYFITAQKASREAIKAIAKDDYLAAALAKQKELLNLALYRQASEAIEQADSIAEHMRSLAKKPAQERLGKAGEDYLDQINDLIERFEFARVPDWKIERRTLFSQWVERKQADGETLGEEFDIPDWMLGEYKRVNYRELSTDELTGLRDVVKQIEHFASLQNKFLKAQKQQDKETAKAALIEALETNLKDKGPPPLTKSGLTAGEKVTRLAQRFDASLLKMEQVVEWLDGGPTGPWHDYLWNGAADAQAAEMDATKTITAKIAQAVASIPKEIRAKMLDTVKIPGIENTVTRKDLLGVALNVGNQSNYDKLLKGMNWTADQVKAMVDQLTAEEIAFVNKVHATLESLWPDIAALQKRLTGLPPEKIEPKAYSAKNGTIDGGYYPVMYSATLSDQGQMQLASSIGKMIDEGYTRATTPKGHTKARSEGFARPFDLDLDRLPTHIAGVVKDLTHREWLIDANWIVNDTKIRAALVRRVGEPMTLRIAEWVRQVVNDRNQVSLASLGVWHRMMEHFRYNVTIVSMGFKASTLLSQLAGVAPAIEVIGGKQHDGALWFAKGVGSVLAKPQSSYDFMTAKSGEMRHRIKTRDRDIRDNLRQLEGKTDLLSQIQEVSLQAIGYMELMVSMPSWYGGYYKALNAGMTDEEAVRMGDRAVRLGQGAGGSKDLASIASRSDQFTRLITMFYTPFSALYGRLRSIGHDFGGLKDVPGLAFRLFWTVTVAATLGELASGHGPDKKKDEDWLAWWLRSMAAYPFLSVPFLRDAVSSITSSYGYQFTPMAQALKVTTDTLRSGAKVIEGDKDPADFAEKAVQAFSYLVGLPTGQLTITGTYLYDLAEGKANPDDLFEFSKGILYRRSKEERE